MIITRLELPNSIGKLLELEFVEVRFGLKHLEANLDVKPIIKLLELLIHLTNMWHIYFGDCKSELLKILFPKIHHCAIHYCSSAERSG